MQIPHGATNCQRKCFQLTPWLQLTRWPYADLGHIDQLSCRQLFKPTHCRNLFWCLGGNFKYQSWNPAKWRFHLWRGSTLQRTLMLLWPLAKLYMGYNSGRWNNEYVSNGKSIDSHDVCSIFKMVRQDSPYRSGKSSETKSTIQYKVSGTFSQM